MKEVNMYLQTSCKGIMAKKAYYISLLEYITQKGSATKHWIECVENETKHRTEIMGAIKALEALKEPCKLSIYSDSQFLTTALNQHWLDNWNQNDWNNAKGERVKNADLWIKFYKLLQIHEFGIMQSETHAYASWQKMELEKIENKENDTCKQSQSSI